MRVNMVARLKGKAAKSARHSLGFLKKKAISSMVVACVAIPLNTDASMQEQMADQFNSMITTTPSMQSLNSTRRGVIAGPGATMKNKISNLNLINYVPPSWEAGCGGIDVFAGSFDFINVEAFTQFLRNVASNALGYAFQLAMTQLCPSCLETLNKMADKIQQWNMQMQDSCQLAQGLVDAGAEAFMRKEDDAEASKNTLFGLTSSVFAGTKNIEGEKSRETARTAGTLKPCSYDSNLMWCLMKDQNIDGWFTKGDDDLLEMVMSLTGTVIVGEEVTPDDGGSPQPQFTPVDPTVTLPELIDGGEQIAILTCDTSSKCLNPSTNQQTFKGLKQHIDALLLGEGGNPGIVNKLATNTNSLTDSEWNLMVNMPYDVGYMIRNLAAKSEDLATNFVRKSSPVIAREITFDMVREMLQAARAAKASGDSSFLQELAPIMARAESHIRDDNQAYLSQHGDIVAVLNLYKTLLSEARRKRYEESLNPTQSKTASTNKE